MSQTELQVTLWTLSALIFLAVSAEAAWDAYTDLRDLKRSGRNGGMRIEADAALRRELLRFLAGFSALLTGISLMQRFTWLPGEPILDQYWGWPIILVIVLKTVNSLWDRHDRQESRDYRPGSTERQLPMQEKES